MIIYLSGPMSLMGPPDFNKDEFAKYAARYRAEGFTVLSPPEMDGGDLTKPYAENMRRDINAILGGVERIYMLPSWQLSNGARLELALCKALDIPAFDAETGAPLCVEPHAVLA